MHERQLKDKNLKTTYGKIDREKLPSYKYIRECFYLLLNHLENYEKKDLKDIFKYQSKRQK